MVDWTGPERRNSFANSPVAIERAVAARRSSYYRGIRFVSVNTPASVY
jgi:hypothetical protein